MKDVFGFELSVGDTVAFIQNSSLKLIIGKIDSLGANHVYIKWTGGTTNKYPIDVVKQVIKPADLKLLKFTIGSDQ